MLTRRRLLGGAVGATAGVAILAACGGGTATDTPAPAIPTTVAATQPTAVTAGASPAASAAGTSSAAKGRVQSQIDTTGIKKGGTIIVGTYGDVTAFNPVTEGTVATNGFMPLLFDSLVYTDPDTMLPMPNLATKWDVSPDSKTHTFTLKQGVKWHDGQPFSADDVKFSYDLYMNPESGSTRAAGLNGNIASVTVKDPQTVVFTLKDVVASFMTIDMVFGILPKHILGTIAPKDFKASAFNTGKPVGTGPFKFVEHIVGDRVTLTANPDYHRGAPALDGYIYKIVKDFTVTLQQLKTGEIDFAFPNLTVELADEAMKQPNLNVVVYDTFSLLIFGYNIDPAKGPAIFQDTKVRQALCYVHDRALIAQKVYNGYQTVAVGTVPPITWAYQPDKITMKYPYDPKMAESLLDEAGYVKGSDGIRAKDGKKLSFTLYTIAARTSTASHVQVLQDALKSIGVEMKARYEEAAVVANRANKTFDYDMFFYGLTTSPDPDQTRYWASDQHGPGANSFGYNNPKVDDLLKQGARTLDIEKRTAIYVDMQNQILADMPCFVSHFQKGVGVTNKRVKNLVPNAVNTNFNAHQWYVTDGK